MKYAIAAFLCTVCLIACGGRSGSAQQKNRDRKNANNARVETSAKYGYKIVKAYPHDTGSYTQGLFWHDGFLYESTGEYGHSSMRKVVLETGKAIQQVSLDGKYFGEGAALLDGKIYQLTWLKGKAFVYDVETFETLREFSYTGEGWGITTDGTRLYMSDGSANITVRDPGTFRTERVITVMNAGKAVEYINELEWIDGKIWANLYLSDYSKMTEPEVVIIDPESGKVEGIIDFSGIYNELTVTRYTDVMNGIACDPETKRIYVTGKRWNKLFEIEIFKK